MWVQRAPTSDVSRRALVSTTVCPVLWEHGVFQTGHGGGVTTAGSIRERDRRMFCSKSKMSIELLLDRLRLVGVVEDEVAQVPVALEVAQLQKLHGDAAWLRANDYPVGSNLDRLGKVNRHPAKSSLGNRLSCWQPQALKTHITNRAGHHVIAGLNVDRNVGVHPSELSMVHRFHLNRICERAGCHMPTRGETLVTQTIVQPPSTMRVDPFAISPTSLAR